MTILVETMFLLMCFSLSDMWRGRSGVSWHGALSQQISVL